MDPDTFIYQVSPFVMETFCKIMDGGDDRFGWRGLAVRIVPSLLEVHMLERAEAAGRSPTRELLWSWAQQNSRVQDLLKVLQDMGHHRALQLLNGHIQEPHFPPFAQQTETAELMSASKTKESFQSLERSSHVHSLNESPPSITFQDVTEATRNFHTDMRIAQGYFADIYKAQKGDQLFAVKLFKQTNDVSWKKLWNLFRQDMEVHHFIKHPNILDLWGCFSDEGRYCLVYPYLPNGSLFGRLHHQDGQPHLSWQQRLNIIKGIAKALHHLHNAQPCPVICGNMCSSNILLDIDLMPKLSDFGLARLRPHSANHNLTITLVTSLHSNMGYLPEEYTRAGRLSFSLDVYSLGMVIMETITGRKVIEDGPKKTFLRDLLVSEVEDSGGVDSCLQFLDPTAGQWPSAVALKLLRLALDCTASHHRSRPSMENVLLTLSPLLPPPSCPHGDHPRSLDDGAQFSPPSSSSIPVEHDEQGTPPSSLTALGPCECSQSEVTYLSEEAVDLYSSWPVQCSCSAALTCDDCRANGFTPSSLQSDFCVVENPAKERLRTKISLYNKEQINTDELFSVTEPM